MKYIYVLLVIFNMYTFHLYSSSTPINNMSSSPKPINLPMDLWSKMITLNTKYQELFNSFKKDEKVNFETIFNEMESFCKTLPDENNAREVYQKSIEARKRAVVYMFNLDKK